MKETPDIYLDELQLEHMDVYGTDVSVLTISWILMLASMDFHTIVKRTYSSNYCRFRPNVLHFGQCFNVHPRE